MPAPLQVADMTIHRIIEDEASFGAIRDFLPDLTPELLAENRAWLQPAALDAQDQLILCFQSYLIRTPHHVILVDTCVGNDKHRPARPNWHMQNSRTWLDGLAAAGFTVGDIDFVLCTHMHVDHVGWNTRLEDGRWVPTFPNARYVFSERELAYYTEQNAKAPVYPFQDSVLPIVEAGRADLVAPDHLIGDHVRLLPTPGHTIDHFAVALGRGADRAVVSGDLIHSPLQARYPELRMRADYDPAQAVSTRRAFLERYCNTDTLCCFSHFPSPSTGRLKRWNKGFQCE